MRDNDGAIIEVGNVDIPGYQDSPPTKWPLGWQSWGVNLGLRQYSLLSSWSLSRIRAIEHSPTLLNHCSLLARHQTCAQLSPGFSLPLRYDAPPPPLFEDNHWENWLYVLSHDICAGFKEAKAVAAVHFLLEHPWKLASQARGWFSNHLLANISSAKHKSVQHKFGPRGEFTCLPFWSVSIVSSNYRF